VSDDPGVRYAKSGDVHVASEVRGEADRDLVFAPGFASHLEFQLEEPRQAECFERLGSFGRLIRFDKRGTGLSDPVAAMPTYEQRMDDVGAVMEAAGSERAVLMGLSEGGPLAALFAAAHPGRTSALVLLNTFSRLSWAEDYPIGAKEEVLDQFGEWIGSMSGSGIFANLWATSLASDQAFVAWWARFERMALSPGAARSLFEIYRHIEPCCRPSGFRLS
jgi:pimeloyl-ACP methyl ester carboxylesterase